MGHFPSGTSLKSLNHFAQIYKQKKFMHYDYGKYGNRDKYDGNDIPPEIDLSNIANVPIAMFVGMNDDLGTINDARIARD